MAERFYTAEDIANELGITAEEVERIAKERGVYGNPKCGKFVEE